MTHTATPWTLRGDDREYMGKIIEAECMGIGHYASIGQTIQRNAHPVYGGEITQEEAEANAAFIVRACNAYDDLVKALDMATRQNELDMLMTGETLRICRAALAKALA